MIHLRGRHADAIVDLSHGVPVIVHWGAPLPDAPAAALADRPTVYGAADEIAPVAVVPEHAAGHAGRPGLLGHRRRGIDWAPRFTPHGHDLTASGVVVTARDPRAGLVLTVEIDLDEVLALRASVTNAGDDLYSLDALTITLPIPQHACELRRFSGRWAREFDLERVSWPSGLLLHENRRGRTSHEAPPVIFANTTGANETTGHVWGAHLAWSGNHTIAAERLADGRRLLQLGELLQPGEIVLEPGDSYRTPVVIAVHSEAGLTPATQQFHRHVRANSPRPGTPRPVLVNTWEAVYFDHDRDRLQLLAERASRVGAERFVLDDGWFGSRRDDTSGLGDWTVSTDAHPDGLQPLIRLVRELGMEFGLWVEPEMVNPDSELYRTHPDWVLAADDAPVLSRHQLVLDLNRPDAFAHVLDQLDTLLRDHDIAFLKWDMNRDHIAASGALGAAGTHAQTMAVYGLIDELRRRHPHVEIESCASGGGRIDHAILSRCERVWTSDTNDALERQRIQRGASMLIPPEVMGCHIGPARSHTTGRRHDLAFRAATAVFGHLGIEWNLLDLDDRELDELGEVVRLHQRLRPLVHGGDSVRFDTDPWLVAHGVIAHDRGEALVSLATTDTGPSLTPPPLLIPGLDPARVYSVERLRLPGERAGPARSEPAWLCDGARATGAELAALGVQPPAMHPESALLVHLRAR